jgi:hypothetical protein
MLIEAFSISRITIETFLQTPGSPLFPSSITLQPLYHFDSLARPPFLDRIPSTSKSKSAYASDFPTSASASSDLTLSV